jgi:hypothetical protein
VRWPLVTRRRLDAAELRTRSLELALDDMRDVVHDARMDALERGLEAFALRNQLASMTARFVRLRASRDELRSRIAQLGPGPDLDVAADETERRQGERRSGDRRQQS